MGDHRVHIKIEMEAHGKRYDADMSINWSPVLYPIDDRIIEWIEDRYEDSMSRYRELEAQRIAEAEKRRERAWYERLKAKFEPTEDAG